MLRRGSQQASSSFFEKKNQKNFSLPFLPRASLPLRASARSPCFLTTVTNTPMKTETARHTSLAIKVFPVLFFQKKELLASLP
jgi:hypothetical protein